MMNWPPGTRDGMTRERRALVLVEAGFPLE
jgi:hypothetical protein